MTAEVFDITIIGGGPAGLFASFYAGLRDARTKIIESTGELGGALIHEYPDEVLRDVAGFVLITARKLAENFIEQATMYEHVILKNETVSACEFDKAAKVWTVTTDKGAHKSKAVVLALGSLEKVQKKSKGLIESLKKQGVKINEQGIAVDATMNASVPGLYACGDFISKAKELNFISMATAEAAIAVNNAKKYVNPEVDTFPGYSTDLKKDKPNYHTNPLAD
ncbi:MAG: FAD-dependent oxidoreductase [candidate division Zixibacteria bacterium]|nr:FAD-dependent oxidoreductase [candidate division Zixibacteria bacterium]